MAKEKNKAAKSFTMLVVTGVVLVAVTLCWFAMVRKTSVKDSELGIVNDASSKASIYVGVTNKNGTITNQSTEEDCVKAIKRDEIAGYVPVSGNAIKLENMVPGSEYFYMAVFQNCSQGYNIEVTLTNVIDKDKGGLINKIMVYNEIKKQSSTFGDRIYRETGYANGEAKALSNLNTIIEDDIEKKCLLLTNYKIVETGTSQTYAVYFSFKFADDATVEDYSNKSVEIESVDAVVNSTTIE